LSASCSAMILKIRVGSESVFDHIFASSSLVNWGNTVSSDSGTDSTVFDIFDSVLVSSS
jgi:hypothetical protein